VTTSSKTNSTVSGVRRRSREMALQLLFQTEFVPGGFQPSAASEMLRRFVADFTIEHDVAEYGSVLFMGVANKMAEIDAVIQSHSAHWKVSRMGLVDLSVMRVAVFEMKFLEPAMQPNIAINEAVDVAKKYGSTDSGAFVNGILDHVSRGL
jgi:N utilization substance protein B